MKSLANPCAARRLACIAVARHRRVDGPPSAGGTAVRHPASILQERQARAPVFEHQQCLGERHKPFLLLRHTHSNNMLLHLHAVRTQQDEARRGRSPTSSARPPQSPSSPLRTTAQRSAGVNGTAALCLCSSGTAHHAMPQPPLAHMPLARTAVAPVCTVAAHENVARVFIHLYISTS